MPSTGLAARILPLWDYGRYEQFFPFTIKQFPATLQKATDPCQLKYGPVLKDIGNSNRDGAGMEDRDVTVGSLDKVWATLGAQAAKQLKQIFGETLNIAQLRY